ncbi:MAG: hypothetical protein ACREWI_05295 [Telluria sp.]
MSFTRTLPLLVLGISCGLVACSDSPAGKAPNEARRALAQGALAPPAADQADPTSDPAVLAFLRKELGDTAANFRAATRDLNGDGKREVLVYAYGQDVCGTGGCLLYIVTPRDAAYRVVGKLSVTQPPIRLLDRSSKGWRDLSVGVAGGGAQARQVRLSFDGRSYPANPTTLPASAGVSPDAGELLIADPFKQ